MFLHKNLRNKKNNLKQQLIYFLVILSISLYSALGNALVLEDLINNNTLGTTLQNKKVGYYVGSFDPLHKGHEAVARLAINLGLCDYVLIYPAWGGDEYKKRTPISVRLEMLFAVFAQHPKVIVTKLPAQELQKALTVPNPGKEVIGKPSVKLAIAGMSVIGIIGSDTALKLNANLKAESAFMTGIEVGEKYYASTIGGIMALPADKFVVAMRTGDNLNSLKGKIQARKILTCIESKDVKMLSSTAIKKALLDKTNINEMVSNEVAKIIAKYGLYTGNPPNQKSKVE